MTHLQLQTLDHTPMAEVLFDDFINVSLVDVGVPYPLGIDDQYRAFVAAVQAAGIIDTHFALTAQTQLFGALLGIVTHRLGVMALAAGAAISALIGAEENMVAVIRHGAGHGELFCDA